MDTDEIVRQSSRAEDKCWRPPSMDLVKINFDGAVFVKKNSPSNYLSKHFSQKKILFKCSFYHEQFN